MKGCTRTLLAVALGTVLAAPAAFAQNSRTEVRTTGNATSQAAREMPRPTLPPQAAQRAQDAVRDVTQQRPADATDFKEARNPTQDPTAQQADDGDMDDDMDDADAGMQARGGVQAAAHSTAAQRQAFADLDVDADGRISAVEADADAAFGLDFDEMDTDDDGFVSDAEYRAFAKADMTGSQGAANAAAHSMVVTRELWTRLDADADGRISGDEADADATFDGSFATFDANADGFVSQEEYRAAAQAEASQGAENAAPVSSVVQRDTFARLDVDADGRISADEADADAGIDGSFSAMDSDGDGFVTDAEFRAHARLQMQP